MRTARSRQATRLISKYPGSAPTRSRRVSKNIIFYTLVVGHPALVIAYFFLNVETHGDRPQYRRQRYDGFDGDRGCAGTYERTPDKPLKANSTTLILFTPQTTGELFVTCMKDGHWREFSVGQASPTGFLALDIHIEVLRGFGEPPQLFVLAAMRPLSSNRNPARLWRWLPAVPRSCAAISRSESASDNRRSPLRRPPAFRAWRNPPDIP